MNELNGITVMFTLLLADGGRGSQAVWHTGIRIYGRNELKSRDPVLCPCGLGQEMMPGNQESGRGNDYTSHTVTPAVSDSYLSVTL